MLQEENNTLPILVLEMVSQTYGQEYHQKFRDYERLGVKYYLIYNPEYSQRDRHQPFELYKLVDGRYQLQDSEPVWLPEIGLGIGRVQGELGGIQREWLAWYDQSGQPYPLPHQMIRQLEAELEQAWQETSRHRQRAEQERQRAEQERLEKLRLMEKLRQLGVIQMNNPIRRATNSNSITISEQWNSQC